MDKPCMNSAGIKSMNELEECLKGSARATRPAFSAELHDRILAAVGECELRPVAPLAAASADIHYSGLGRLLHRAPSRRSWQALAIAASLLLLVGGGSLAGLWQMGRWHWGAGQWGGGQTPFDNLAVEDWAAGSPSPDWLASNDADGMNRTLAAADHLDWLDEDARMAALWFVDELPLDGFSSDADSTEGSAGEAIDEEPAVDG
jgi:hypothetical protein